MDGVKANQRIYLVDNGVEAMGEKELRQHPEWARFQEEQNKSPFIDRVSRAIAVDNGHIWSLHRLLVRPGERDSPSRFRWTLP